MLQKQKKVGVLLPIYNSEKYIDACIRSITSQSYPVKIYAIDDASTDNTYQIASSLIHVHRNKQNLGWVKNLNKCGELAIKDRCDYIFTMNSDDFLASNCIERLLSMINGVEWVNCYASEFDGGFNIRTCREGITLEEMKYADKIMSFALITAKAWQSVGGYSEDIMDEELKAGLEDWDFWIKMLKKKYKYRVCTDILYYYRVHPEQLWRKTNSPERFSRLHQKLLQKHYA